jgi:hypothetical protein
MGDEPLAPDPGMIATTTGMRARDPWEMEQRPKKQYSESTKAIVADALKFAEEKRQQGWTRADAAADLHKMLTDDLHKMLTEPQGEPMQSLDGKAYGVLFRSEDNSVIPPDEFIVFRPHDNALLPTLEFYYKKCEQLGAEPLQLNAIAALMGKVSAWREQHPDRCKVADVKPGEKLWTS